MTTGGTPADPPTGPTYRSCWTDIRLRKMTSSCLQVDRLTKVGLAGLAKLVELFDAHGVSFVSVIPQFNTTTSMAG